MPGKALLLWVSARLQKRIYIYIDKYMAAEWGRRRGAGVLRILVGIL